MDYSTFIKTGQWLHTWCRLIFHVNPFPETSMP